MTAWLIAISIALLTALAEWLHARRARRVGALAFGPDAVPRRWVAVAPFLRVAALGGLAWGLVTLVLIAPEAARHTQMPEGGYRHLVVALDVSPSMQLTDAGPARQTRRAQRASEVLMSCSAALLWTRCGSAWWLLQRCQACGGGHMRP
jgi:Ca-activated chloride channel family protein